MIYLIPLIIGIILLLLPEPIIHNGVTLTLICLIISGTAAAFLEETMFRGVMISYLMKILKSDNKIIITWLLSGIVFSLMHGLNIFYGADPLATLIQIISCLGFGLTLAAIYLRTGDLWIPILGHTINNFGAALTSMSPITSTFTLSLSTFMELGVSIVFIIYGYYLIRSSKRDEITTFWNDRWSNL